MFSLLLASKDVIVFKLTLAISIMVTEALPIAPGGHGYGKDIPGSHLASLTLGHA